MKAWCFPYCCQDRAVSAASLAEVCRVFEGGPSIPMYVECFMTRLSPVPPQPPAAHLHILMQNNSIRVRALKTSACITEQLCSLKHGSYPFDCSEQDDRQNCTFSIVDSKLQSLFSPFNPQNIHIQLLHNAQHNTQALHEPIHSNAQHTVRGRFVFRPQDALFILEVGCAICSRIGGRDGRKGPAHKRGEFFVDDESAKCD